MNCAGIILRVVVVPMGIVLVYWVVQEVCAF